MLGQEDNTPDDFTQLMQQLPVMWTVLLAVVLCTGLVLWAFGGKMAHKGVMLTGFVIGGLGLMGTATAYTQQGPWVLVLGIGGAIAGVLLAWLLFRFWMGLSAAMLLALVVPVAALIWQGSGPSVTVVDGTKSVTAEALGVGESYVPVEGEPEGVMQTQPAGLFGGSDEEAEGVEGSRDDEIQEAKRVPVFDTRAFGESMRGEWMKQADEVKLWWGGLTTGQRRFLMFGGMVGALVGLVLGLVLPYMAAAVQAAVVGSVLIFFAGRSLLVGYVPSAGVYLPGPGDSRGVLLTLGLITLLGVLVQWSLRKRSAEDRA